MNDTETLADKAKKIGEDVAAIWAKVQEKGGVLPHMINTENLVDILNQIITVDKWGAKGAFFYDLDGTFYDFYTTHEVMRMTQLPPAPEGSDGWALSLQQLQSMLSTNSYAVVIPDGELGFDSSFHINITNSSYLTMTIGIVLKNGANASMISWGDGTVSILDTDGAQKVAHTYESVGEYDVKFILGPNATLIWSHHSGGTVNNPSDILHATPGYNETMFGANSGAGSHHVKAVTSFLIGDKTKLNYPFFAGQNGDTANSNNISGVTFAGSNIDFLPAIPGNKITTMIMPQNMTDIQGPSATDSFDSRNGYAGAFKEASSLTTFRPSPSLTRIPTCALSGTSITSFDFSNIKTIEPSAFYNTKLTGVVDLSNVETIMVGKSTTFGAGTTFSSPNITKIILNPNVSFGRSYSEYSSDPFYSSSHYGAFEGENITEITNLPSLKVIPPRFICGTNLTSYTIPDDAEMLLYKCLETKNGIDASCFMDLPDTVKVLGGLGKSYQSSSYKPVDPVIDFAQFHWPTSLEKVMDEVFTGRKVKNLEFPDGLQFGQMALRYTYFMDELKIKSSWILRTGSTWNMFMQYIYAKKLIVDNPAIENMNYIYANEIEFGNNMTSIPEITYLYGFPGEAASNFDITVPSTVTSFAKTAFVHYPNNAYKVTFEGQVPDMNGLNYLHYATSSYTGTYDMSNCTTVPRPPVRMRYQSGASGGTVTIIVPDSLYDSWIEDPAWASAVADTMVIFVKASEV